MNLGLLSLLIMVLVIAEGCMVAPSRPKISDKAIRSVPFEARSYGENSQFRPRVLVIKAKLDSSKVPEEWVDKAEGELWKQIEKTGVFALLKPTEVAMDLKDFVDHGQWDWAKIQQAAREKSIPLVMEWELAPIHIQQDADPIGIIRERRRQITIQVKARLMDSRKTSEIAKEIGEAHQQDKDILWLSRTDGKITTSDYDSTTLELLLKSAVEDLVPQLVAHAQRVSWTGRVAMIKGDRVYLNVGRQSGLQVGDILKVLESGDEVFDPETGDSIGKVPGRMKGTLEIISYFGQDGSIAVVHSGAGFQENDAIEYY